MHRATPAPAATAATSPARASAGSAAVEVRGETIVVLIRAPGEEARQTMEAAVAAVQLALKARAHMAPTVLCVGPFFIERLEPASWYARVGSRRVGAERLEQMRAAAEEVLVGAGWKLEARKDPALARAG